MGKVALEVMGDRCASLSSFVVSLILCFAQGGKRTLLRQTCLITFLTQIISYVLAVKYAIMPVDRTFTHLGASDRILSGQYTFLFVELAETVAALRGATDRSLVIMDKLRRGASTFDGKVINHTTVQRLVNCNGCLALFTTHPTGGDSGRHLQVCV